MTALESLQNTTLKNALVMAVENTKQTGARFVGLNYTNEQGETSRYTLIMGINILDLYKSDLESLQTLRPSLTDIKAIACDELIASIKNSLEKGIGNNDAYTLKGYYDPITPNGEVKLHVSEEGETFLYIRGYVQTKTVLVAGEYKTVNNSPKTLAKKELEKNLRRGKLRTFKINVASLHSVRMNGLILEIISSN